MTEFEKVKIVRQCCFSILPQLYCDRFSITEQMGKIVEALNVLIENNNKMEDYVKEIVRELIESDEFESIISEIISNYMLNVKYPPNGLIPATGNGSADDTLAVQGCIDYAQATGMCVYFPNGAYLVGSLQMKDNVSLSGAGRYNSKLVLKGGATQGLIRGNVSNLELSNLTLDGNGDSQVNNLNVVELNGSNYLLSNLIISDGYDLVKFNGSAGHIQISNVIFEKAGTRALNISGTSEVNVNNVVIHSISTISGICAIECATNNTSFEGVECFATVPDGIIINSNNINFNGHFTNATNNFVDNGNNNTIIVTGVESNINYIKNIALKAVDINGNFSGDVTITANDCDETYSGNKGISAVNVNEVLSGSKNLTGVNKSETLTGSITTSAINETKTLTGKETTIVNRSEFTATLDLIIKANELLFDISTSLTLKANNIIIDSIEPLKYNTPTKLNSQFNYIEMKGKDNVNYKVLVEGENVKGFFTNVADFGAIGDSVTDDTTAFQTAINSMIKGGTLYIPAGYHCLVSQINVDKPINIIGNGGDETVSMLIAKTATTTILNITTVGVNVENIHFDSLTTQTGGTYINITGAGRGKISECYFGRYYTGITHNGTINEVITNCFFENGTSRLLSSGGSAILIGTTTYTSSPIIENITITSPNNVPDEAPDYGICLKFVDGGFINNVSIIKQNMPLVMNPEGAQFTHAIYIANTLFDSSRHGATLSPIGTAIVEIISFTNCWFSGHTEMGVRMLAEGGGKIAGINISNSHCFSNAFGMYVADGVDRLTITSTTIGANTNAGILVTGNAKNVVINGNNVGAFGDIVANNAGITLGGTSDKIIITNNVVNGNTASQITVGTSGTNIVKENNIEV